jgi:predicted Zn-dependent protease
MDSPTKLVEKSRERTGEVRSPRRSKWRLWASLLAIPASTTILLAGWKLAPRVDYQIRIHLAERAIADGRLDEAHERLDLLIEEKPARTWPRFLRARVARKQGRITEAEEGLQRAVELGLPVEQARREHDLLR